MARKRHHSRRQNRNELGRFVKVLPVVIPRSAPDMQVLYNWRSARQEYAKQLAAANREERWGGLRSIFIFTVMASVLVGMLVAGVS